MTDKTKTVSARIPNEVADEMEKRLKAESYSLRELITDYANGRSVNTEKSEKNLFPEGAVKEIGLMANYFGVGVDELFDAIFTGLEEGYLSMENGKVIGVPEIDLDEFKEACKDIGAEPETVLKKAVASLRKTGKI